MTYIAFTIGLGLGLAFGFLLCSMLTVSSEADRDTDIAEREMMRHRR